MRVVIFGASGMVGQGVLLECLRDEGVDDVLVVGRSTAGRQHPKLREILTPDLFDVAAYADALNGLDACFFCLGVSSIGMSEEAYRRITSDLTLAIARELASRNDALCFTYVSGAGTDSTERGRAMWARVKGATENALLCMAFRCVYLFRLGFMAPLDGIRSRTKLYALFYLPLMPFAPLLRRAFPRSITTTRELGQAMLLVARDGWPQSVLEQRDICAAGQRAAGAMRRA